MKIVFYIEYGTNNSVIRNEAFYVHSHTVFCWVLIALFSFGIRKIFAVISFLWNSLGMFEFRERSTNILVN